MDIPSLTDGLLYPSEDDRPFEAVDWPAGPASARDAVVAHVPPGVAVDPLPPSAFFDPLRGTTDADRFDALRRGLTAHLSDLTALRASDGSAEVQVFVIGRAPNGKWAGVRTVSVET